MKDRSSSLNGQLALVTGASSGIGKVIALALARCGTELLLLGRNERRLRHVQKSALRFTPFAEVHSLDLSKAGSARALLTAARTPLKRLDVLVHCAGEIVLGGMESARDEAFERQWIVNVFAPYRLTKALLPFLKRNQGQIVFMNSSILRNPRPGTTQFAATQHALKGLADGLRTEVNEDGVRVLSAFPGRTATPRQEKLFQLEGKAYAGENLMQPEDIASMVVHALSLPRTAEVTDVYMRPMKKF